MRQSEVITVIGAGYVGLTAAVLFASVGHKVHLIDVNESRIKHLKRGKSFFYEQGIEPLIKRSIKTNNFLPTMTYKDAISESDFVFSCVGTPDNPDGSSNLSYVFAAAEEALKYMRPGTIYIQKSTVPVGTGRHIEKLFSSSKNKIDYVSNPEFLGEGTAISDSLWPDRIVAGAANHLAAKKVVLLHKGISKTAPRIARLAGLEPKKNKTEYYITNLNSAELIKVTANAFLALKISFANSIAKLADRAGADIKEVMGGVGSDRRIGAAFLNAGRGYGGGCFPKDVSGLISSAAEHGVDLHIMTAASDVNSSMPGYIAAKAKEALGGLSNKEVAVLGLAFKAGTSDARRSPGVKLANILSREGAKVTAYDPKANSEAREDLLKRVILAESAEAAIKDKDAVFIATDWPEFKDLDLVNTKRLMTGNIIVDCMNTLDKKRVEACNLTYLGVGC